MHRDHRDIVLLACLLMGTLPQPCRADEWPQWRGPQRDGVWRETGIIREFPKPDLDLKWRADISGGYSGPTVADGRVYVTDRLTEPKQVERVLCFDRETGKLSWSHSYGSAYGNVGYPAGPRASVLIRDGKAYSLGTMGHLFCFDAAKGTVLWTKDLFTEYEIRMPVWGLSASPLIEDELLICEVGGKGACLVAFDRLTGREVWKALEDRANYSAPVVIEQAGRRVLVCWTGDNVVGLDPKTGKVHWSHPFPPKRAVMGISTPVAHNHRLLLTGFFDGSLLVNLGKDTLTVEKAWHRVGENERKSDALHSVITTPIMTEDSIYGIDAYGQLRGLDLATGDRLWENLGLMPNERWAGAHFVRHGDKVWIFTERGELIISRLSREGYEEISRAKLIAPTLKQLGSRGGVCWSHPAFAYRHVFARNDQELVCASLAAE